MLKVTVLSINLKGAVTLAHHAISSRSQLPILLNFLLEAKNGELYISSTDLEIGIKTKVPAKVEEEGEITVPGKTFLDLVSNIDQEKVELSEKQGTLELKAEKLRTTFPTLPANDFPKLYESKGEKAGELKKEDFDKELTKIVFAAAQDSGRPALSGVFMKKGEKGITVVATDGYRLSLKQKLVVNQAKEGDAQSLLIPARVIKELAGLKGEEQKIEIFTSDKSNQVLFQCGDTIMVGRLIEAEYPDYQKIIPEEFSTKVVFDRQEAQNAVRVCSVFAREAANIVKMSIGKNNITFSASASSVGENEAEIDAKTEGEENEIAFNARYLLDLFSNLDTEGMIFEMSGPLSPGVFRIEKDDSYLHLIMPIRVQN